MADSSDDERNAYGGKATNAGGDFQKKGLWTPEEDEQLISLYRQEGCQRWPQIAARIPGRNYKQCCERWHNHVNPEIRKDPWNEDEYRIILEQHHKQGNNWTEIAKSLQGRTGFAVKSHWKGSMRKKVEGYLKSVNRIDQSRELKSYTEFKNAFQELTLTAQDIDGILGFLRKKIQATNRRLSKAVKPIDNEDFVERVHVEPIVPLPSKIGISSGEDGEHYVQINNVDGDSDSEDELLGDNLMEIVTSHPNANNLNNTSSSNTTSSSDGAPQQNVFSQQSSHLRAVQTPSKRSSIGSVQSTPGKDGKQTPVKRERILWSAEEDHLLREGVRKHPNLDWVLISIDIPAKTVFNCRHRWTRFVDPALKKGHWTEEEDQLLATLISEHGSKYTDVAMQLPGRTGKQCRNRWLMTLDPALSKKPFSGEEYRIIIRENQKHGNNWKLIADNIPGRTGALISSHFHNLIKRKIIQYMNSVGTGVSSSSVAGFDGLEDAEDEGLDKDFTDRFKSLPLTDAVLDALVTLIREDSGQEPYTPNKRHKAALVAAVSAQSQRFQATQHQQQQRREEPVNANITATISHHNIQQQQHHQTYPSNPVPLVMMHEDIHVAAAPAQTLGVPSAATVDVTEVEVPRLPPQQQQQIQQQQVHLSHPVYAAPPQQQQQHHQHQQIAQTSVPVPVQVSQQAPVQVPVQVPVQPIISNPTLFASVPVENVSSASTAEVHAFNQGQAQGHQQQFQGQQQQIQQGQQQQQVQMSVEGTVLKKRKIVEQVPMV